MATTMARLHGSEGIWGPPLGDGWRGWQDIVDYIHTENVSYTPEERSGLSAEFGNPFAAGKQAVDIGGSVYSTGGNIPRIRDRFQWSLGPMPWGENTDHANFEWNDQPHIVAATATVTGVEEQVVDWVYFLAGPDVQGRVSIDRGHVPLWKGVKDLPEAKAAPPEGMHHLYEYIASPNLRAMQWYVPGGFYGEVRALRIPFMDASLLGECRSRRLSTWPARSRAMRSGRLRKLSTRAKSTASARPAVDTRPPPRRGPRSVSGSAGAAASDRRCRAPAHAAIREHSPYREPLIPGPYQVPHVTYRAGCSPE